MNLISQVDTVTVVLLLAITFVVALVWFVHTHSEGYVPRKERKHKSH